MFRHAWLALLFFFASLPALGAPSVTTGPGARTGQATIVIATGDTSDSRAIPVDGVCSARVIIAGSDVVELWGVNSPATAATSGTQIGSDFTASTPPTAPFTWTAGSTHVKVKGTTATTGGSVVIIDCNPLTSAGGGGATLDIDGNGLRESSPIIDADGDGSGWVTCTAKDTPDSACKVAGERIYRDFSDDVSCMIRGCGSIAKVMEHNGTIFLGPGVHVNFGCWKPGGTNDPTDPTTHDSTGDAAYDDCPDGEQTRKQTTLSFAGWGGTIVGVGMAQGRTDTTALAARGYGRTDATYIVNDLGNNEDSWFTGVVSQSKTLGFGYANQDTSIERYGIASWFDDPGGWGTIEASGASQTIQSLTTATLCVAVDGGAGTTSGDATGVAFDIQSITTGTNLLVEHDIKAYSTRTGVSILTARDAPPYVQGSCSAGYVGVPVGVEFNGVAGRGTFPSQLEDIIDNAGQLYILRSDYKASGAQLTQLTLEPQDWWNEPGGDCSVTGEWTTSSPTSADNDCDTWHLVSVHGYQSRPALKDVSVRYWHWYAIDGESAPAGSSSIFEDVTFEYGNGGAIADPGSGWRMVGGRVIDTSFFGSVIENFGMGTVIEDLLIQNSAFQKVMTVSGQTNVTARNTRIENSEFSAAYGVGCGVKNLTIDGVYATGRYVAKTGFTKEGLISMNCNTGTAASKSDFIFLRNLREDAPGSALVSSGIYTEGAGQVLVRMKVDDTDNYDSLGHVFLSDSAVYNDVEPTVGDAATGHDEPGCLVAIEDRTSAGGAGTNGLQGSDGTGVGELDTLLLVKLNGNIVQGHPFCVFGQEGMYDDVGQCADYNSTGGPPQTGGPPDDLCDSDGSTPVVSGDSESALFDSHWALTLENNLVF